MNQTIDFSHMEARLLELSQLEEGWDGYDAPALSQQTIDLARQLITYLILAGVSEPRNYPTPGGGFQLEFWGPNDPWMTSVTYDPLALLFDLHTCAFKKAYEGSEWQIDDLTTAGFQKILDWIRPYVSSE